MRLTKLKLMAFTSAIALGFAFSGNAAFAQVETVNVDLTTTSAITSDDISNMDFGEWVTQIGTADDAANDVTITLTNDGTLGTTVGGNTDSVMINVTPSASEGVVTVQTPAASALTMTRGNTVVMSDANVTLTSVSYRTATEAPTALNADAANGTVTVLAGATDETVTFGGVLTFGATPGDGAHTGSFDVTFSY